MKTVFMGTPDFAVPCLQRLAELTEVVGVFTQPDRPKGRGLTLVPPPVKTAAVELGLPVFQPARLRETAALSKLRELAPELIVVVAYAQLLPESVLTLPYHGCINVHASLLPAYRGGAPIHWSVVNGEKITGVTTMQMDRGLDTGDILLQVPIPVHPDETTGRLHDRLASLGADLLADTLQQLQNGELSSRPQPREGASYARNLIKADGLIDWHASAQQVHDRVRGLNPWPVAYTSHNGKTVRIWATRLAPECQVRSAVPGQVIELTEAGPIIATGSGAVLLLEVQPESKRRMSGAAYANGYALQAGDKLSD